MKPLWLILLFLSGCNEVAIVHDLNERDANEIVVLLSKNDISADKQKEERNQEIFWNIKVSSLKQSQAQGILVANNLPKMRQGGLEGICKDSGMIVTAETEKCRKLLAYKGEIINSLESIPGVVSADVVLNIPEKQEFVTPETPQSKPTAAVTLRYLTDANAKTELSEVKVQEFVANSIEGMDARDVSVIISYLNQRLHKEEDVVDTVAAAAPALSVGATESADESKQIAGLTVSTASEKKIKIYLVIFLGVLLVLASGLIITLVALMKARQNIVKIETPTKSSDQKLLEA